MSAVEERTAATYKAVGMRAVIQHCAGDPPTIMPEPNSKLFGKGRPASRRNEAATKEAGFALPFAVAVLAALTIGSVSMVQMAASDQTSAVHDRDLHAAQAAADSAVNMAADQLVGGNVPEGSAQVGDAETRWSGYVEEAGWVLTGTATVGDVTTSSRALLQNGHLLWLG